MFWIIPALLLSALGIQNFKKQVDERRNIRWMSSFVHKLVIKEENRRKDIMARMPEILKELD